MESRMAVAKAWLDTMHVGLYLTNNDLSDVLSLRSCISLYSTQFIYRSRVKEINYVGNVWIHGRILSKWTLKYMVWNFGLKWTTWKQRKATCSREFCHEASSPLKAMWLVTDYPFIKKNLHDGIKLLLVWLTQNFVVLLLWKSRLQKRTEGADITA
jgi:hypothetical protein